MESVVMVQRVALQTRVENSTGSVASVSGVAGSRVYPVADATEPFGGTSVTTIGGGLTFRWGWMLQVRGSYIRPTGAG
jgi:hypothetical protein